MGNQICKSNYRGGYKGAINDVLDFLNCGEPEEFGRGSRDEVIVSPKRFVDESNGSYHGVANQSRRPAGSPVPARQHGMSPNRNLPGESCVVTYDVGAMGYGPATGAENPYQYPGQSMVVTGASQYNNLGSTGLSPAGPPMELAAQPLQSSDSFDVERPYKLGDRIEIWSTSQQAWCSATVDKAQGEWIYVSYKGAEGRLMSKIMPNSGHEHLRFHGAAWDLPANRNSPSKDLLQQRSPLSPGAGQTNAVSVAPLLPTATAATYKVGDQIEIYSTSQSAWCRGRVEKAEGEWVTISYKGVGGQPMSKLMPNGHEQLRFPQAVDESEMPAMSLSNALQPPPAPQTAAYKAGDRIEIWSTSQNSWRPGSIAKVDGEWVHVSYSGPGGQAMNKIMPNGHAHIRLQAGFAA